MKHERKEGRGEGDSPGPDGKTAIERWRHARNHVAFLVGRLQGPRLASELQSNSSYRVLLVVGQLGWVDLDLGSPPCLATYSLRGMAKICANPGQHSDHHMFGDFS